MSHSTHSAQRTKHNTAARHFEPARFAEDAGLPQVAAETELRTQFLLSYLKPSLASASAPNMKLAEFLPPTRGKSMSGLSP